MLDTIQHLEDRVSELIGLLRQTAEERDALRARVETLEADLAAQQSDQADRDAAEESGPLAELERQRLQALEVVESALSELVRNESVA